MYEPLNNNHDCEPDRVMKGDIENNLACCICFEGTGDLVDTRDIKSDCRRCDCSAIVHLDCLNRWYRHKHHLKCIVCNSTIKRIPKPRGRRGAVVRPAQMSCRSALCIVILVFVVAVIAFPDFFNFASSGDQGYLLSHLDI
jgi:hypothetical protein